MRPAGLDPVSAVRQYDRLAPVYDVWTGLFESKATDRALKLAAVRDGEKVLEVGIGTGISLTKMARENPTGLTAGLDASARMLRRTRGRAGSGVPLLLADCRTLPFSDDSFDLLFNAYLLDLLSEGDMRRTLQEFHRVLRPGGRLVQVCMTHDGPLMRAWGWIYDRWPGLLGGCRSVATAELTEAAGFRDVEREVVRQLGFPSEIVRAARP